MVKKKKGEDTWKLSLMNCKIAWLKPEVSVLILSWIFFVNVKWIELKWIDRVPKNASDLVCPLNLSAIFVSIFTNLAPELPLFRNTRADQRHIIK